MTRQRFATLALTFAVAGLPLSGVAWAQERTSNGNTTGSAVPRSDGGGSATPRGDGGGSSAGSSGSTSSGSSSDGGMSSGSSSPSSQGIPSPFSSFEPPRRSDDQATRSRSGGSSTGTAAPRGGGSTSTSTRAGGNTSSGRTASSASDESGPSRRAVPAYSRPRDGRPVTGEATERGSVPPPSGGGGIHYPYYPYYPYYPWGFWGPGYGFGLGYLYYDPFFGGYGDYGYVAGGGGGGGYSVSQSYRDNGSLRLKINPKQAQIYIDGYFVGVVDSYDGAFQKLGLEGGGHKVELKADGYEPLQFEVLVTPGETVTYKGEMKRIQ